MSTVKSVRRVIVVGCVASVVATGCSFQGLNSLPLPGAVGRGADASSYRVQIANVATLQANSPVLIDDVVVGSVRALTFANWHADVEISVKPGIVVPANAVATVGQTSLLGSMHLALDPPPGVVPTGRLQPGATMGLNDSSTYPSTEQTLSSLSTVVNGGGLGQLGDVVHSTNVALTGRQDKIRDLLGRLDRFVGTLDTQRDALVASLQALDRLSNTFAGQRDVITRALERIPPAIDVLDQQRPKVTTALTRLGAFSDIATRLVDDSKADLVQNLQNLDPTLKALADVGPDIDTALAYASAYPYGQDLIDRGVRGDYMNLFAVFDLTVPRLKRTLLLGTRFGELHAPLRPAPGDPYFAQYSFDPMGAPLAPPPAEGGVPSPNDPGAAPPQDLPMPPLLEPVLPVTPPAQLGVSQAAPVDRASIFAGPYPPAAGEPAPPPAPVSPAPGGS